MMYPSQYTVAHIGVIVNIGITVNSQYAWTFFQFAFAYLALLFCSCIIRILFVAYTIIIP